MRKRERDGLSKTVAILGYMVEDLVHYWSRIYHLSGMKCCIVDCSREQDFRYTLPEINLSKYTYREIDIFTAPDNLEIEEMGADYDITFYLLGSNQQTTQLFKKAHYRFLCTDTSRAHVLKIKGFIDVMESEMTNQLEKRLEVIKIYRDLLPTKINAKYIDFLLASDKIEYTLYHELTYLEQTAMCHLMNQYNGISKFSKAGGDFKQTLKEVALTVEEIDSKTFKKAFKLAERGK